MKCTIIRFASTRELQAMASEHEEKPVTLRYPRDTSLDPQLVWKGKDEQDVTDLEVTAAPIYIQEKIHPQAIIEDIRERASEGKPKPVNLFSDLSMYCCPLMTISFLCSSISPMMIVW